MLIGIKPKADSTLRNMQKSELIEYIRCLEHNYNSAVWFNENQARYIEKSLTKDVSVVAKILAREYGKAQKMEVVKKTMAYALHQMWKRVDEVEPERRC